MMDKHIKSHVKTNANPVWLSLNRQQRQELAIHLNMNVESLKRAFLGMSVIHPLKARQASDFLKSTYDIHLCVCWMRPDVFRKVEESVARSA